jgi:twitching motility protein PilI
MAKKVSLRDFQESLSVRLQSAKRGETTPPMLGIRSGGCNWLLELPDSGEVVPLASLTTVPLTQPWFAGVVNIRGALHAVVDFAVFTGAAPTPRTDKTRLLLVGTRHSINSALLVENTVGLKPVSTLKAAEAKPSPPGMSWIDAAYTDESGQEWLHINLAALLSESVFLDVGL